MVRALFQHRTNPLRKSMEAGPRGQSRKEEPDQEGEKKVFGKGQPDRSGAQSPILIEGSDNGSNDLEDNSGWCGETGVVQKRLTPDE